jgi:hypothetical protein
MARPAPSTRTISGSAAAAISSISACVRLAIGCGTVTYWYPGNPSDLAMASAVILKTWVQMLTAGMPARSSTIPSAKLAALQEPQSPMAATAKSQLCSICWTTDSSTGVPK